MPQPHPDFVPSVETTSQATRGHRYAYRECAYSVWIIAVSALFTLQTTLGLVQAQPLQSASRSDANSESLAENVSDGSTGSDETFTSANALTPQSELAWVGDVPIRVEEVQQQIGRVLGNRSVDPERITQLAQEALEVMIDRQLVLRFLERQGRAATSQDVDLALRNWEQRLEAVSEDAQTIYRRQNTTPERVRTSLYWTLSWQRMLDTYLTDVNLERFFTQHQADHDGRRLRVAHIFWEVNEANATVAREKAEQIREEILSGKVSFADAAREHSQAPSSEEGGDLGWIERHDPMPESFSRVAFQLKQGELSAPVLTTLGLHLIQCQEIEPGTRQWTDIRPELERALARYLFRWAADKERPESTIRRRDNVTWQDLAP